jgi:hypothetical protein
MGGVYITARGTKARNYIGVGTDLTLPSRVASDKIKGIKPEYILGFYGGSYGLDIGVLYQDYQFKLFYWALSGTCGVQGTNDNTHVTIPNVSVGEKITLKAYLNGSKITCEAIKNGTKIASLDAPLTSNAVTEFKKGCYINRELVIASNATSSYLPCNIYTYDAIFSNGFVTRVSDYNRENLNDSNSAITKLRQKDSTDRYMDVTKLKVLTAECGVDKNGYSYEKGSCDLNQK